VDNERILEILIKARNAAGPGIDQAKKALESFLTSSQRQALLLSKGLKELGQNFRQLGKDISQVGMLATIAGAAITGPFLVAFKNAEEYSSSVSAQMIRFRATVEALQISIANALVPIIEKFNNILSNLLSWWNSLSTAQQQMIVQATFLTGVFLTLGGTLLMVTGKIVALIGTVAKLSAAFLAFAALNPVLVAVGVAIAALAVLMWKFKAVSDTVIGAVEALWRTLLVTINGLLSSVSSSLAFIEGAVEKVVRVMALLPGPQKKMFEGLADGIKAAREQLDKFANDSLNAAVTNAQKLDNILSTGNSDWAEKFNEAKEGAQGLATATSAAFDSMAFNAQLKMNAITELVKGVANAMTDAMSTFFFDAMTGQLKSLKDYFASFGRAILQTLSQVIAKLLVMKMLQSISSNGSIWGVALSSLHNGGEVGSKAHNGSFVRQKAHDGLSPDEVNITALSGEGVISRRGMANIGGAQGLSDIESGKGTGGGGNITINMVVSSWDASDVMRNSDVIVATMGQKVRNNGDIRDVLRKYT